MIALFTSLASGTYSSTVLSTVAPNGNRPIPPPPGRSPLSADAEGDARLPLVVLHLLHQLGHRVESALVSQTNGELHRQARPVQVAVPVEEVHLAQDVAIGMEGWTDADADQGRMVGSHGPLGVGRHAGIDAQRGKGWSVFERQVRRRVAELEAPVV